MSLTSFKLESFGQSDVGLVRRNNEDVFLQLPQYGFYLLADGMGGHNAGEIAAQETIVYLSDCIDKLFRQTHHFLYLELLKNHLSEFIQSSNERIYRLGLEHQAYKGMGTTLSTLLFYENLVISSHVGDSRIYRFRNNALDQLSQDHTLKNKLLEQGLLEKAIRDGIRYKNVLTKAIGAFKKIIPDIGVYPVQSKDLYLLCSDGLSDYVTDDEILCIITSSLSLKDLASNLINKAKIKGGCDNITVLLTKID